MNYAQLEQLTKALNTRATVYQINAQTNLDTSELVATIKENQRKQKELETSAYRDSERQTYERLHKIYGKKE